MGDYTGAIEHFRTAVALDDGFIAGHYNLGRALTEVRSYPEAFQEFRRVIQIDSAYALAYLGVAGIYVIQDMDEQAIDAYKRAIRFDPDLLPAYLNLASLHMKLKNYDEATGLLLRARDRKPGDSQVVSAAGRAAILARDFDTAVRLLTEAVQLDTLNTTYRNDLATALMLGDRKQDAIEQWEIILSQRPEPSLERVVIQNLERARADTAR
jgi:tetratricopeptide (TPR) repeat protein